MKKKDQNAFRFLSKKNLRGEKMENSLPSFLWVFTVAKQTQEAKRKMGEKIYI